LINGSEIGVMGLSIAAGDGLEAGLATTFDVLSWEMELAAARCIKLDATIGAMMNAIPEDMRDRFTEAVHGVDLLSQQLTGLSAFARRISDGASNETAVSVSEALGDITLSALADRMSTALGGAEKGINDGEEAGDLDLF
jgi:hypothetical protein